MSQQSLTAGSRFASGTLGVSAANGESGATRPGELDDSAGAVEAAGGAADLAGASRVEVTATAAPALPSAWGAGGLLQASSASGDRSQDRIGWR